MTAWVVLLRGINVGGRNPLPMAPLRGLLERLGATDVKSVLQSGNLVFRGAIDGRAFGATVEDEIARQHGFRPRALVLAGEDFRARAEAYPWPEAWDDPKSGHIWFCDGAGARDPAPFVALAAPDERVAPAGAAFYLHAPSGIGRSKLAARAERLLGVPATARNLATTKRIVGLLDGPGAA